MPVVNRIAALHDEMIAWRHDLHAHPEIAFEEHRTSDLVASRLAEFGLEVHRGLAGTGVVGSLRSGSAERAIALRADMDALDIAERNDFAHRSVNEGKMHACGHDGHTAMLLGAAKYLAETRNFDGTVHFIFQPAEENEGGARVMIEDGLFERFPVEAVYGLHNWPGLAQGRIALAPGPMMAAFDIFEMTIQGRGSHAAMPHQGVDAVVVAAQVVTALQTIASRNTDPQDAVVVSVTQIHGGDTWNVIPGEVTLRGTARSFRSEVQDSIEPAMRRVAGGVCTAFGAAFELSYERRYPPTVNSADETELAAAAAAEVVGEANLVRDPVPCMGSEDFSFMLEANPGCYIWLGGGRDEQERTLHNPHYDFNDEILPLGASYWARLAERLLAKAGAETTQAAD